MTDEELIQERLNTYSEMFDLYLDRGTPHPTQPKSSQDPLQDYLQEAVYEPFNYFHCQEDTTWREVFKSSLLAFFTSMLKAYLPLEKEQQEEQRFISSFFAASTDTKRKNWEKVVVIIQDRYTTNELNPFGYQSQLQSTSEENYEPIFEAMRQQWFQSCDRRILQEKQKLLQDNKQQFQFSFQEVGKDDYETLFSSSQILFRYPELKEIVEIIGRDKPQSHEEKDTTITRYIPTIISHAQAVSEVDGVSIGNVIQQALPSELVYLSGKSTEDIFFHRLATKQLQQMASKPPTTTQEKTEHSTVEKPRLIKGPIIVSVDTSGSMSGKPLKVATSLLLQLLQMARKQKRPCYLITYSVRARAIDLAHPANWRLVKKFLREGFSGGTDGNEMLRESIATLQSKTYSMADVLIISDFAWCEPEVSTMKKLHQEQAKGTKFYGLGIDSGHWVDTHKWLDKLWNIEKL